MERKVDLSPSIDGTKGVLLLLESVPPAERKKGSIKKS